MKHLCIINPMAEEVSGRVNELVDYIKDFFNRNPRLEYLIHITRWKRDASGYVMRYVKNASDIVRVYTIGGGGTLFEVINGVMGLPNVQVAYYPMGKDDDLLSVFGKSSLSAFRSMRNLSLSPVITIDTILAGNHYVMSNILLGIGAASYKLGKILSERFLLPLSASYTIAGFLYVFFKAKNQHYRIEMEETELDNDYIGIYIANVQGTGGSLPAPEARFNDGYMDLYVLKQPPKNLVLQVIMDYQKGLYAKWPQFINHYRCKKIKISSPEEMMLVLDGEVYYNTEINIEIQPFSLNIVCPREISRTFLTPPPAEKSPPPRFDLQAYQSTESM
jgi:diacylglycerol kinase family enzyme